MPIDRQEYERVLQKLQYSKVTFYHSPSLWDECCLPVKLDWLSVEFNESNRAVVPSDKSGVYAFIIKPRVSYIPETAYLLYIGRTNRFRRRYGEYIYDQAKGFARPPISRMLRRWDGHLWFYYASVEKVDLLEKVETELLNACIPPYNSKFKGRFGQAVSAFRQGM